MPVLVRPHPARMKEWADVDLSAESDVAVWGGNPIDADAKAGYYNSLYHSAAVVGLNTSAFLEGAIVGRPVFATLLPEHHENQEGTIHFHYLMNVAGGLLQHVSARSAEHVASDERRAHGQRAGLFAQPPVCRSVHPAPRRRRRGNTCVRRGSGTARSATTPACPGSVSVSRCCCAALAPVAALARVRGRCAAGTECARTRDCGQGPCAQERVRRCLAREGRVEGCGAAPERRRAARRQRHKAERAAEWRRTKTMQKLKQRMKKRIGIAS